MTSDVNADSISFTENIHMDILWKGEHKKLYKFFKSVLEQDKSSVVLCDLNHTIIYMNPAAIRNYAGRGGEKLIGKSLLECHNQHSQELIKKTVAWFDESPDHNRIFEFHHERDNRDVYMVALRDDSGKLIGYYEKHEYRNSETAHPFDFDNA